MFLWFVTILVVAPVVLGQAGRDFQLFGGKPGSCPPFPNVDVCYPTCLADFHCEGLQKCCRTACGGSICISPVTAQIVSIQEKPGSCPEPSGPWVCSNRCRQDSDCRGKKKCCRNRCGANACLKPDEDSDNEI